MQVAWNIGDIAAAVAALEAPGRLPLRTVVVPNGRMAHAIRRKLVEIASANVLNGTRFATPAALATDVLEERGVEFMEGEEARRAARLGAIFRDGLGLQHFDDSFLRKTAGWDEAFAQAIGDLEDAGLTPALLMERATGERDRDLAIIWEALDLRAGKS